MEDTQALHHQQQLEQQQMEEKKPTKEDFDFIAYRCLGIAQSIKDLRSSGNVNVLLFSEQRLIELATEYETLRARLG